MHILYSGLHLMGYWLVHIWRRTLQNIHYRLASCDKIVYLVMFFNHVFSIGINDCIQRPLVQVPHRVYHFTCRLSLCYFLGNHWKFLSLILLFTDSNFLRDWPIFIACSHMVLHKVVSTALLTSALFFYLYLVIQNLASV